MAIAVGRGDFAAAGMTARAGLHLGARLPRRRPFRRRGAGFKFPHSRAGIAEADRQSTGGVRRRALRRACPGHMPRARPMAGFTGDIDLRPSSLITVRRKIEVLAKIGRVAVGAHIVPGLVRAGPVQWIAGRNRLIRVQMEPALPAGRFRTAIPGQAERLDAAAREGDQILLQRIDAERVGNLIVLQFTVRTIGSDEVLAVLARECGGHAEMRDAPIVEIAEDAARGRLLHSLVVMRAAPALGLGLMAGCADLTADETIRCKGRSDGKESRDRQKQRQPGAAAEGQYRWPANDLFPNLKKSSFDSVHLRQLYRRDMEMHSL